LTEIGNKLCVVCCCIFCLFVWGVGSSLREGVYILFAYMTNKIFESLFIVTSGKEEIRIKNFPSPSFTWLCFLQEKGDKFFCSLVYSRNYIAGDKNITCICKMAPAFHPLFFFSPLASIRGSQGSTRLIFISSIVLLIMCVRVPTCTHQGHSS